MTRTFCPTTVDSALRLSVPLIAACLGMRCDHAAREVRFDRPLLPRFIDEARIRNLRLAGGSIDLLLERRGEEIAIDVLKQSGDIRLNVAR